ncbi:MAG: hypothetical protein LC777_14955, partial [Actinobacteria bacterium]|nr:hypothetical protein [Actinomycetota bacterium]
DTRQLPEGGHHDPLNATGLPRLLAATLKHAQTAGQIRLDQDARQLWHDAYHQLARPHPGALGQITARAEAHTIRLAVIYALADGKHQISPQHLNAAVALHDYATRSAAWALHGATGQPLAERCGPELGGPPAGGDLGDGRSVGCLEGAESVIDLAGGLVVFEGVADLAAGQAGGVGFQSRPGRTIAVR